jgi:glycosyltransferase involved in cell wall biosynthesis
MLRPPARWRGHDCRLWVAVLNGPDDGRVRVLYSFPYKLGAERISYTAWQQVNGLAAAGAKLIVFPGAVYRPVPPDVQVGPTLARGPLRVPYRLLGKLRALTIHDHIVAHRLEKMADQIDIVHAWPSAALQTLRVASRLGIPSVLERPNAHTRFGYEVVQRECARLGISLPAGHEHAYNPTVLRKEETEFQTAYRLLCPSDFVVQTFLEQGFDPERLVRHTYGYDPKTYYPTSGPNSGSELTVLFVGVCAVRKGLHFALEAWLRSPASLGGTFLIAGAFLRAYQEKLTPQLSHPSVHVLGHRKDVPELMRRSDVLVLPSIEEGFGLVCAEAMGSGCVPLVSEACTDTCKHMQNALVHPVGDVDTLTRHITAIHEDRGLLDKLRTASLKTATEITWTVAGRKLLEAYRSVVAAHRIDSLRFDPLAN